MYIAMKEIRRSLGRFGLLTSAVGLLVLLLLFFQAVAGTLTLGLTGAVEASAAEVFVYDERARRNPSASVLDPVVVDEVAAVDGVAAAAPIGLTVVTGRIAAPDTDPDSEAAADAEEQVDLVLFGVDPTGPSVPREVAQGRLPQARDEALASSSSLDASVGLEDVVTVGGVTLRVVGVSDDAAFNVLPTLYVPFDTYAQVVQDRAGAPFDVPLSLVGVALEDGADAAEVTAAIDRQVDGVEALDRATAVVELPGAGQITQSFSILYLLLFVVVTIVTGVFFLILTVQKRGSLVLLRAVGADRADILTPVLLQVVLVTGLGAVGGALTASGLLWLARDTFGAALRPTTAGLTVIAILLLGLLASLGAVRRVLKIDPVDAVTPGGI